MAHKRRLVLLMQKIKNLEKQFEHFFVFLINQKIVKGQKYCHECMERSSDQVDFIENRQSFILHEF